MFALFDMIRKGVQFKYHWTAVQLVITGDAKAREKIAQNPWYSTQIGGYYIAPVDRAGGLTGQPFGNAGTTESVLADRSL